MQVQLHMSAPHSDRRSAGARRVLSAAILAGAVALSTATASARDFRSSDTEAPGFPTVRAVEQFDALLRQRTGGRLSVSSLGAGDRDSENFTVAQLRAGNLDMARVNVAALHSVAPSTVVLGLPFLFRSTEHLRRVLDGPIGEEVLASLTPSGLIGLCFYDASPRSFYTKAKPIRTVADLRGLRVRVQPAKPWVQMAQALGAQPVVLPYNQVYAALAADTIDAAENNIASFVSERHHTVSKVYSLTEHSHSPSILAFSKRSWDLLSPADQAIVRQAAKETVPYFRMLWASYEDEAHRTFTAAGGQVVTDVDRDAFFRALRPLHEQLVTDLDRRRVIERIGATE
jgi:tripartite ATP-independent transporter DctP family solute receptor